MNFARGIFRLWAVITLVWVASMTWIAWDEITFQPHKEAASSSDPNAWWLNSPTSPPADTTDESGNIAALKLAFGPPALLLLLGLAGMWVVRGFKR